MRKLILFDVDGTLIAPGPVARLTLAEAIADYLGRPVELAFADVAGFTDPTIIQAALKKYGGNPSNDGAVQSILGTYIEWLTERLPASKDVRLFPGASELVRACADEGWAVALMTGNIEASARLKVERTGLWDRFDFGVFGDEGNSREDLPWVAREKAWNILEEAFTADRTILIGDTPNDARVAALNGVACMVVCRREEPEWRMAIEAEKPTWIVEDFEDVDIIMSKLKGHQP